MSSFDNHQHIEEVMADASDEERRELDAWVHGLDSQSLDEEEDGPEWGNYYEDHCGDYEF